MSRLARLIPLAAVALLWPLVGSAQYPSELVGFNGPPIGDPATCQEMFKHPEVSGTTTQYVVLNSGGNWYNASYRNAGLQTEGAAAEEIIFRWADPNNVHSWVRVTSTSGAIRPDPSLHIRGKVRFKLTNLSEWTAGTVGICLGIRETGVEVPQLADGGSNGPIEWFGVDPTPNGIVAGADGIVNTAATGDDIQVYPVGTNIRNLTPPLVDPDGTAVILPGPNGVLDTAPTGDDQRRSGYYIDDTTDPNTPTRRPIPVITLAPDAFAYTLEWDLAAGTVSVNGVPHNVGVAPFTGDGVLNVVPPRATLEHIAITKVASDTATLIDLGIDELQFESPDPEPTVAPTVRSPIIAGDQQVTVTSVMYVADSVTLLRNHNPIGTLPAATGQDVVFSIASAVPGDVYTATQHNPQNNTTSPESLPVTVLLGPPPYTFSIVVDGGGSGGCEALGWEWVNVTAVNMGATWVPQGAATLNEDSSQWQTVDVSLDNQALMKPCLGGDGVLEPSPNGLYTIDSLWFTVGNGADPDDLVHDVYIDTIQALDPNGVPHTILGMEDGVNRMQYPRGQSPITPTTSTLSNNGSYDGAASHQLTWTFPDNNAAVQAVGMLQRVGYQCNTSATFPDTYRTLRFHLLCRAKPTAPGIPLPVVVGPIIVGNQTAVRVTNDATATSVELFLNGQSVGSATPAGAYTDFTGLTLHPGDSVSAKQTLPAGVSDFALPRGVSPAPQPPSIQTPLLPGSTTVRVNNCLTAQYATASTVTVYINGTQAGTAAGGTASVNVTVPALQPFQVVTATQTVNGAMSAPSDPQTVLVPAPVLYKAPAANETGVRVFAIDPNATQVVVIVNGTTTFAATPNGATSIIVPVSGLAMGNTVTARQTIAGVQSADTDAETVTTDVTTAVFFDHFDQYAADPNDPNYLTTWQTSTGTRMSPSTDKNATPGGRVSLYNAGDGRAVTHVFTTVTPTATVPAIWNVNIYDSVGPGSSGNVYARCNGPDTSHYLHIGISNLVTGGNLNYYQARILSGPNWVDLKQYEAPQRSIGWHTFTLVLKGTRVDCYIDGKLSWRGAPSSTGWTLMNAYLGCGTSVANSQVGYFDDYVIETGPVRFEPRLAAAPLVASPLKAGDISVTLNGIDANALNAKVYADNVQIASVNLTPPNPPTRTVTVPMLVARQMIAARQTVALGESEIGAALEVGSGNGDLLVCIGIRETGDPNALGTPGGTTGAIEWIGASGTTSGAPQGKPLLLSPNWQTFVFDPLTDPITAFPGSGNGQINGTRGVLEHLAVAIKGDAANRSSGPYELYVDDVENLGAGTGGADFMICDFESFAVGSVTLLNTPAYSGTTSTNLSTPPNTSAVSTAQAFAGTKSEQLTWFFRDSTAGRWARITTTGVTNVLRPIIDLTKPIRMRLLLKAYVPPVCLGDCNCDRHVDFGDINPFVLALSDFGAWQTQYPGCNPQNLDVNGDGHVDFGDINPFVAILSGGGANCP